MDPSIRKLAEDQAIKNIETEFGTDKHNNKSTDIKTETKYNDITYLEELIAAGNNFKNTLWLKEQYEGYKYLSTFTGDNYETAIIDFKNELMKFPSNIFKSVNIKNKDKFIEKLIFNMINYPYNLLSFVKTNLNKYETYLKNSENLEYTISNFETELIQAKQLFNSIEIKPEWFTETELEKYTKVLATAKHTLNKNIEITNILRDKYFVNYGYINSYDNKALKEFNFANKIHNKDMKELPELHKTILNKSDGRGNTEYNCSCGFAYKIDSTD
jgi:hypothetical protein